MKKKALIAMLLACSFAFGTATMTACDIIGGGNGETGQEQGETQTVAVTGVTLNKNVLNLKVGGSETLTATVVPENATTKTVSWESGNQEVATVDQNGKVTAHAKGTATITVTTTSGSKTDVCTVNVSEDTPAPVKVESVSLDITSKTLKVGATVKLTPSFTPANPDNKNVSWSSSNTAVASVSDGLVTANKSGTAIITVTTADGNKTAQCTITVEATITTVAVTGVSVNPTSATLKVGDTKQLTKTITPAGASNQNVTWQSGNTAVATVDGNGLVTAKSAGTATVTVKTADGNFTANCSITVEAQVSQPVVDAKISYTYAGNECAAFEWADTNAANAIVEYKLKSAGSYTALSGNDKQYLVRQLNSTTARVDLVGLKGGAVYDFKITTSTKEVLTASDVTIHSYDRSGYAHFGKSDGVGAYNDDGTPKDNAVIVYVNEANKNTVKATVNGRERTGIVEILQNAGTSKPLIVRIVGTVGAATWNSLTENNGKPLTPDKVVGANGKKLVDFYGIERSTYNSDTKKYEGGKSKDLTQATLIKDGFNSLNTSVYSELIGLNSKAKYDASKDEFDSCWNDCSIQNVKNVTVEGIGEGAEIIQWGMTFKNSSSIEVRNLHFDDYTEDACSFEASESGVSELSAFKSGNIWLHHNTFDEGKNYWDVCNEQDKHDGDGSTDFKGLKNITIAYNHYISTHKTNLIGGGDGHSTANVTFHHNYYEGCNQRMPLGRQANMHMYNNYYSGSTLYSISLRAGAYAFIENCYFTEDASNHYPVELVTGSYGKPSAKIINCVIDKNKVNDHNKAGGAYLYIGTDRNATVDTSDQRFAKNFDTNSSLFYYKDGKSDVTVMFTAEETKTYIPQLAGVQKHGEDVTLGGAGNGGSTGTETPGPTPDGSLSAFTVNGSSANGVGTENTTLTSDIALDNKGVMALINGTVWKIHDNTYLQSIPQADVDTQIITIDLTEYTGSVKLTISARRASTNNTNRYYRIDGNGVSLKSTGYGTSDGIPTADTSDTFTLQCGYKYTLITHGGLRFKSFAFVPVN